VNVLLALIYTNMFVADRFPKS